MGLRRRTLARCMFGTVGMVMVASSCGSHTATSTSSGGLPTYTIGVLTDETGVAASAELSTPIGVKAGVGLANSPGYHIKVGGRRCAVVTKWCAYCGPPAGRAGSRLRGHRRERPYVLGGPVSGVAGSPRDRRGHRRDRVDLRPQHVLGVRDRGLHQGDHDGRPDLQAPGRHERRVTRLRDSPERGRISQGGGRLGARRRHQGGLSERQLRVR